MFSNYFKVAWRNLLRNKGFSVTNLIGLSIGMTCSILILLWVQDELNFNKSQKNYKEIYQLMANRNFNNEIFTDPNMVLPLAQSIKNEIPQVKNAVVTTHPSPINIAYKDVIIKKTGLTVSDLFFNVFTVKFLSGNAATALSDPSSIVLTQSTAKALFGNDDPVNKIIRIDNDHDAKVSAVVKDLPSNTTIQFDYIKPFNYSDPSIKQSMSEWVNSSWLVYIQTVTKANINWIDKKINEIKQQHDPNDKKISTYFTFPMSKWRLYSDFKDGKNVGGQIEYVRMFSLIALVILLIACVNFMNLSTARSEKRAKEVGIRKTLGSPRKQLIFQFFIESVILAFISFVISVFAVYLLLPAFNSLVNKQLFLPFSQAGFWIGAVGMIVFTGVVAGSYPALYLSSFNPVKVLKGTFDGKKTVLPRHILIVAQFVISILLISATIIIYQQIKMIRNRDTGYNPNNLITIPGTPDTQKNYAIIKQTLLQTGMINAVTRTMAPITEIWWKTPAPDWEGKPDNMNIIFTGLTVDNDFTKTMGIRMIRGKDFTGTPADSGYVLMNKAAADAMNASDPVGMKIRYGMRAKEFTILGITDNVIQESPFKPVEPMMIMYNPDNSSIISIRLNNGVKPQKAIGSIQTIFQKYNPGYAFDYSFVDKEFEKKFINEELVRKLSNLFAALAIFICCIGLAGLAAFTIKKESVKLVSGKSLEHLYNNCYCLFQKNF